MLYLTSEADIFQDICQRRYQPRTQKELNHCMGRVFEANQNSPTLSMINSQSISFIPANHLIWLPDQNLNTIDYGTVLAHQDAMNAVNYSPAWNRLQLYDLLNSPIDMDQAAAMTYVHQDVRSQHSSKNKAEALGLTVLDQSSEYFKKHLEKLIQSIESFDDLINQIVKDRQPYPHKRLSESEKKALQDAYKAVNKEYAAAVHYVMQFIGRMNLMIHRDPWRIGGLGKSHTVWEISQDPIQTLSHGLGWAKMSSFGTLFLDLWSGSDDVYTTYKNNGNWGKELAKEIGEVLGGIAGSALFFIIAPEAVGFMATVLIGGLFSVGGSDFLGSLFVDTYDESERIF